MKDITLILLVFLLSSCAAENKKTDNESFPNREIARDRYNVGFLIMDGTFNTEFTAPFDIFQHTVYRDNIKAMNVFTVAMTLDPVTTFEGIRILPDFSYRDKNLPRIDILVVTSAEHHIDTDLENEELISFVQKAADSAMFVTSHCDGAFVLAKAGLLTEIESTTFPGDIELYRQTFPDLKVHDSILFVHDGKFITSAGGAKSFEAALYLTEYLYGAKTAESIAQGLVIDWNLEEVPHLVVAKPQN